MSGIINLPVGALEGNDLIIGSHPPYNNRVDQTIVIKTEEPEEFTDNESEQNWFLHFLRYIIFYGKIMFVIPTSLVVESRNKEITLKGGILRKGIYIILQFLLMAHIIYRFSEMQDKTDDINVMKWIWKIAFVQFIWYDMLIIYHFGWKCHTFSYSVEFWNKIYAQSQLVEDQFRKYLSISIWRHRYWDQVYSLAFSIIPLVMGLAHILSLRSIGEYDGSKLNDDDKIKTVPFTTTYLEDMIPEFPQYPTWLQLFLRILIALPDIFVWGIWHYGDALRLTVAFAIWKLYNELNNYLDSPNVGNNVKMKHCNRIIEIHQNITILLGLLNRILSPLTFTSIGFCVVYFCYYANFLLFGFGGILRRICFANFFLRTSITLWLTADINTKAHLITAWLEKLSSGEADAIDSSLLQEANTNKLIIFTSQVYHEKIGFKGLHFFTVSTGFIGKIVSILLTYTVVILQFAGDSKRPAGD